MSVPMSVKYDVEKAGNEKAYAEKIRVRRSSCRNQSPFREYSLKWKVFPFHLQYEMKKTVQETDSQF
jgi:hypothetical protein